MKMIQDALIPISIHEGTPYPIEQSLLDKALNFTTEPPQPFVHPTEAVQDIVRHNKEERRCVVPILTSDLFANSGRRIEEMNADAKIARRPTVIECEAIDRLTVAMEETHHLGGWTPDVFIKMFPDLDTVFCGGALLGNVLVKWQPSDHECLAGMHHPDYPNDPAVCVAEMPNEDHNDLRDGQCKIHLNGEEIFAGAPDPFKNLWGMLAHKLVVSTVERSVYAKIKILITRKLDSLPRCPPIAVVS